MASPHRHGPPLGLVLIVSAVVFVLGAFVVIARGESPVLAWNAVMLDAVRCETTPPPLASRNLAIVHLALLDAAAHVDDAATGLARLEVVLAATGCATASALCPGRRGAFEAVRDRLLAGLASPPTAEEWKIALRCATAVLDDRDGDGASRSVTYIPHAEPGQWRRTAPFFRPPEMPQWTAVQTFGINVSDVIRPPGPPPLDSVAWQTALAEIRDLGGRESTVRTAEQSLIARFWSDFSYTNTPPGHWNEIAAGISRERGLDEHANAKLFARLNVALADAAIVCWQAKYTWNFWRPITALADKSWQPFLHTPAHPEYPSGHSVFSGAAAEVLASFFGSDRCDFTVRSDGAPGQERIFHSFSDAAREISLSRIYAGIHFRFSCEDGIELGRAVGREIVHQGQPAGATTTLTEVATR